MGDSVRLRDRYRKFDLIGETNSTKRPFAKAMQSATWGRTGRIADALGLCQRTLEAWGNPNDPQHGPLWQLDTIMRESLESGADPADALAPLRLLNQRFTEMAEESDIGVARAASEVAHEAGEAVSAVLSSLDSGRFGQLELDRIEHDCDQAIYRFEQLKGAARAAVKDNVIGIRRA